MSCDPGFGKPVPNCGDRGFGVPVPPCNDSGFARSGPAISHCTPERWERFIEDLVKEYPPEDVL